MSVREHWINVRVNPEELARMPVTQRPVMKNFCFLNGSMSISPVEPRRMM